MWLSLVLAALDAQALVDKALAPFVTVGTITATTTAWWAFAGKVEAVNKGWDTAEKDAYVAAMVNEGIIVGATVSFIPLCVVIADALT